MPVWHLDNFGDLDFRKPVFESRMACLVDTPLCVSSMGDVVKVASVA